MNTIHQRVASVLSPSWLDILESGNYSERQNFWRLHLKKVKTLVDDRIFSAGVDFCKDKKASNEARGSLILVHELVMETSPDLATFAHFLDHLAEEPFERNLQSFLACYQMLTPEEIRSHLFHQLEHFYSLHSSLV